MSSNELVVYWAPRTTVKDPTVGEHHMLYEDPTNLYSDLLKTKSPNAGDKSFFACPGSRSRTKKTFVFRNTLRTEMNFNIDNFQGPPYELVGQGVSVNSIRPSALNDSLSFHLDMQYLFFTEEPVIAMFNSPVMTRPGYTRYAILISGAYDIGQWFRPYPLEMQTWDRSGTFVIEQDEPLFHMEILTDKKIVFKRFVCNDVLSSYAVACSEAPNFLGKHLPLSARYERFRRSRMNELILKEIKANLL